MNEPAVASETMNRIVQQTNGPLELIILVEIFKHEYEYIHFNQRNFKKMPGAF